MSSSSLHRRHCPSLHVPRSLGAACFSFTIGKKIPAYMHLLSRLAIVSTWHTQLGMGLHRDPSETLDLVWISGLGVLLGKMALGSDLCHWSLKEIKLLSVSARPGRNITEEYQTLFSDSLLLLPHWRETCGPPFQGLGPGREGQNRGCYLH